MAFESKLNDRLEWRIAHSGSMRFNESGALVFADGPAWDWHFLRCTDHRLKNVKVKIEMVALPCSTCDTNIYVHSYGGRHVCSINKDGAVDHCDIDVDVDVNVDSDGIIYANIEFINEPSSLSIGTSKPIGKYQGSCRDQYVFDKINAHILPSNKSKQRVLSLLWGGSDPLSGIPDRFFDFDLQGWNSQHGWLDVAQQENIPSVIVEVGVWKGGSVVYMANKLKERRSDSVIIAVDTWLGSSEHWLGRPKNDEEQIYLRSGLYDTFRSNIVRAGVANYVVPLPIDSLNAAEILKSCEIQPDFIHIDGGHDYESVMSDLRVWWPILRIGGLLVGDDYYTNGTWPEVRKAFDEFFDKLRLGPVENESGKCRIRKPT